MQPIQHTWVIIFGAIILLFCCTNVTFAQTKSPKNQKDVWQYPKDMNKQLQKGWHNMKGKLQNLDMQVQKNGELIMKGDTIDLISPMHDLIGGMGKIAQGLDLPEKSLQPLQNVVNQLPQLMGSMVDGLKSISKGEVPKRGKELYEKLEKQY